MTERPEHLVPTASPRGFVGLPPIPGAYGGEAVVWESSSAEYPRVWLKLDVPINPNRPNEDHTQTTIHLDAAEAWKLAEQLMTSVQCHYHGDARPDGRVYDEVGKRPDMVCNWQRPEHIRVETGPPTYQEITLVCEHGHSEGYPTRRIEGPVVLDHRVIEFIEAHRHAEQRSEKD